MRKKSLETDEYYHIYNRGVDKRNVFMTERDYERFLYLLFACNDIKPLLNSHFYYRGLTSIVDYPRKREPIVDISCLCLMPNHIHFLLKQRVDGGISLFMQKLGTGYTMYFNTKYKRSGALFQGTFKSVHVDNEEYLTHLTRYIHLNPVELIEPGWKKDGIKNWHNVKSFLKSYRWSSYTNYLGKNQLDNILNKAIIQELFPDSKTYYNFVKEWATKDLEPIEKYLIESL